MRNTIVSHSAANFSEIKFCCILIFIFLFVISVDNAFAENFISIDFSNETPFVGSSVDAIIRIDCPDNFINHAVLEIEVPKEIQNFRNVSEVQCEGFLKDAEIDTSESKMHIEATGKKLSHFANLRFPLKSDTFKSYNIKINSISLYESNEKMDIDKVNRTILWGKNEYTKKENNMGESQNITTKNQPGDIYNQTNKTERNGNNVTKQIHMVNNFDTNEGANYQRQNAPTLKEFYTSTQPPYYVNSKISFVAIAYDSINPPIFYQFAVENNITRKWDKSNTWDWIPGKQNIGRNIILVWAANSDNIDNYFMNFRSLTLEINDRYNRSPTIQDFQAIPKDPQEPGTIINLSVSATDENNDRIYYKFFKKMPGDRRWTNVTDYIPNPYWIWETRDNDHGIIELRVDVIDKYHSSISDDSKSIKYALNKPPVVEQVTVVPSIRFDKNYFIMEHCDIVNFSCNATDLDGDIIKYDWHSYNDGQLSIKREFSQKIDSLAWFANKIEVKAIDDQNIDSESFIINLYIFPSKLVFLIISIFIIYLIFKHLSTLR